MAQAGKAATVLPRSGPAGRLGDGEPGRPLHVIGGPRRETSTNCQACHSPGPQPSTGVTRTICCPVVHREGTDCRDHPHHIHQAASGSVQAICSCGWRSPGYGADKAAGTMDPLQRAADAGDLHRGDVPADSAATSQQDVPDLHDGR